MVNTDETEKEKPENEESENNELKNEQSGNNGDPYELQIGRGSRNYSKRPW